MAINGCTFSKEFVNPNNKLKELKWLCNVVPPLVQESASKEVTTEPTSQFLHFRRQKKHFVKEKAVHECDTTLFQVGSDSREVYCQVQLSTDQAICGYLTKAVPQGQKKILLSKIKQSGFQMIYLGR